ncbi:hypothetical protein TWF694_003659 [Orbilia ellipsospora]|uniref:Protein kinase domain-containing protein n=1 Tax=Orbilia ellipsospora TaxID=2528407 RepID=A0AAV9WYS5_9PEZI
MGIVGTSGVVCGLVYSDYQSSWMKLYYVPTYTYLMVIFSRAVVKAGNEGVGPSVRAFGREYNAYQLSTIASNSLFRSMYDLLSDPRALDADDEEWEPSDKDLPQCLAFEWLDYTLADLPLDLVQNYDFIWNIMNTILQSAVALNTKGYVNTYIEPRSLLVSDASSTPVMKIADLHGVFKEGDILYPVPTLTRFSCLKAPEHFLGYPAVQSCTVWSLAAMIFQILKPEAFTLPPELCSMALLLECESRMIAYFMKLFPHWKFSIGPCNNIYDKNMYERRLEEAEIFVQTSEPSIGNVLPFSAQIERMDISRELRNLLSMMLIPDAQSRPSASDVLRSDEYRIFSESTHRLMHAQSIYPDASFSA